MKGGKGHKYGEKCVVKGGCFITFEVEKVDASRKVLRWGRIKWGDLSYTCNGFRLVERW